MNESPRFALASLFGPGCPELVEHVPHCRRLDMEVLETGPYTATMRLPYREELVGDPVRKVVFGGVITTLLDHVCGLAVSCSLAEFQAIATLDLRIDYLRAAEPACDLIGEARCYRLTTHVAFVRGAAYERSAADPFASCVATYMVGANQTESVVARAVRARSGGSP